MSYGPTSQARDVADAAARAAVALISTGATVAAILKGQDIPEPWWPCLVAVLSYLYRLPGAPNGQAQHRGTTP